jgi:hypothetical protein
MGKYFLVIQGIMLLFSALTQRRGLRRGLYIRELERARAMCGVTSAGPSENIPLVSPDSDITKPRPPAIFWMTVECVRPTFWPDQILRRQTVPDSPRSAAPVLVLHGTIEFSYGAKGYWAPAKGASVLSVSADGRPRYYTE